MALTQAQRDKLEKLNIQQALKEKYVPEALAKLQALNDAAEAKKSNSTQGNRYIDEASFAENDAIGKTLLEAIKTGGLGAAAKVSRLLTPAINPDLTKNINPFSTSYIKAQKAFEERNPSDSAKMLEGLVSELPAFAVPIGEAGVGIGALRKIIGSSIGGAAAGALSAEPGNSLGSSAGIGGAIGGSTGGILHLLTNFPSIARHLVGSSQSPTKINNSLARIPSGEPIIGAEVLDSQRLRDLESGVLIGNSPAQVKKANEIFRQLEEQGLDIVKTFGGDKPIADKEKALIDMIEASFNEASAKKTALYDERNALSEKYDINMTFSNTRRTASKIADELRASKAIFGDVADYAFANQILRLANRPNSKNILIGKGGRLLSVPTAMQSYAKKLYEKGMSEKDIYTGNAYKALANAIRQDLKESFEKSGVKELQDAQKAADDYFKNDFALFRDKEIAPYLNDKKDFRTILGRIIGGNKYQYPERLAKFMKAATQQGQNKGKARNVVLQHYFGDAIQKGEDEQIRVNSPRMVGLFRNLDKPIKNELFNKEQLNMLNNLDKKWARAEKTFGKFKLNPATGYNMVPNAALLNQLKTLAKVAAPLASAGGLYGGFKHGASGSAEGIGAGTTMAILAAASPSVAAKILSNPKALRAIFTSDKATAKAANNSEEIISKLLISLFSN